MDPISFYQKHSSEIELLYCEINLTDLPSGLLGEVTEAFSELEKIGITSNERCVLQYLSTKAYLIKYYKSQSVEARAITEKYIDETAAGSLTPEWLIALAALLAILSDSLNVSEKLGKILNKSFNSEDKKILDEEATKLNKITEVEDLKIAIGALKVSKKKVTRRYLEQRKKKKSLPQ